MLNEKQTNSRNKYMREYMQKYREKNREKYNENMRAWRAANKDKVEEYRAKFWEKQADQEEKQTSQEDI